MSFIDYALFQTTEEAHMKTYATKMIGALLGVAFFAAIGVAMANASEANYDYNPCKDYPDFCLED